MSISVAFRSFFAALFDGAASARLEQALAGAAPTLPAPTAGKSEKREAPRPAGRSDALTLLSALQRESRFVDFVKESLDGATDEQIGAVVRDMHRECGAVVERMFALRPLLEESEGASIEAPAGFDAARYRLTGNVTGQPPYRGVLRHHGWQATRCELPSWTGQQASALVIAPAEMEL